MALKHYLSPSLLLVTFLPFIILTHIYDKLTLDDCTQFVKNYWCIAVYCLPLVWEHTFIYSYIWLYPDKYKNLCENKKKDPIKMYAYTSFSIKVIQIIFMISMATYYKGPEVLLMDLTNLSPSRWLVSFLLISIGQTLNFCVYNKIGLDGVYYGFKLGRQVDWVEGFPFNIGTRHPQYVGAILSWWGLFNMFISSSFLYNGYMMLCLMTCSIYLAVAVVEQLSDFDNNKKDK